MKVVISVDLEGISGIVSPKETAENAVDYKLAQKWATMDTNAAVEGALEGKAVGVVVHDCHGLGYRNILLNDLHPKAELIRGHSIFRFEESDLNRGYDAAFLIGYHAGIGDHGLLSHAYSAKNFRDLKINGDSVDEAQIGTALCGYFGIPVVLITGDNVICEKMKKWLKGIQVGAVKHYISRYTARCLSLERSHKIIKSAAKKAMEQIGNVRPFTYSSPITFEVICANPYIAQAISKIPGTEYDGELTVSYTCSGFLELHKFMHPMVYTAMMVEDSTY